MEGHFGRPRHACIKGVLNTDGVREGVRKGGSGLDSRGSG
jgi:hypothetical protein